MGLMGLTKKKEVQKLIRIQKSSRISIQETKMEYIDVRGKLTGLIRKRRVV